MYPEFPEANAAPKVDTLALDWDETTGDYPLGFGELAARFSRVIIVTVNDELSIGDVTGALKVDEQKVAVFCCPDDNLHEVDKWKAEICVREKASLMFDDSPHVVRACHERGINAICVSERAWKFEHEGGQS